VPVRWAVLAWLCLAVGVILYPGAAFPANIMTPSQALAVANGGTGWTSITPTALTNATTVTVPSITSPQYPFFTLGLTSVVGSVTVANPTSFAAGSGIQFVISEDSTGGEVVSWGSDYQVVGSVSTLPNAKTTVFCAADTSSTLQCLSNYGTQTPTISIYTSNTTPLTLPATNNLREEIKQGSPAALVVNLNAIGLFAGFTQCVKDYTNNFATNNATIKTSDSSTIDGIAGATGYVMNQTHQSECFVYDGSTNWMVGG